MIDLSLSEEQRDIVEGAATLLRDHDPVSRLRESDDQGGVHGLLAEWGWFAVGLPEDAGGLNFGAAEEALLYLEAGKFLLSPSILATTLAAALADADDRAGLVDGSTRAAMAIVAGEDAYCLGRGDAAFIVTIGVEGIALFPAGAFRGDAIAGLDETLPTEKGTLDTSSRLAFEPGRRGMLLATAMLVGLAKASSDLSVEYAKVREQFGQPIGAFQAIKHKCADMGLRAFAAEAQLLMAAAATVSANPDADFQTAAAAQTAIAAAKTNGAVAIQVHGGMGFTAECSAHHYLKRAHVMSSLIGGIEKQQEWLLACPAPK